MKPLFKYIKFEVYSDLNGFTRPTTSYGYMRSYVPNLVSTSPTQYHNRDLGHLEGEGEWGDVRGGEG